MLATIRACCNVLVKLKTAQWMDEDLTDALINDSDKRFLACCEMGGAESDLAVAKLFYGPNEPVSDRYRKYASRIAFKLEGLILLFSENAGLTQRSRTSLEAQRKFFVANVLLRMGELEAAAELLYEVVSLSVTPETILISFQSLIFLASMKAPGENPRVTEKLLASLCAMTIEVEVVGRCAQLQTMISAQHGVKKSRLSRREEVANDARFYLKTLLAGHIGLIGTIAASRLANACGQALGDEEFVLTWCERLKQSCIDHHAWTADMKNEYHNQRILCFECLEKHQELLDECNQVLPNLVVDTAAWVQIMDSRAKSLIKLGRLSEAMFELTTIRESPRYVVHPVDERKYIDLRFEYVRQLIGDPSMISSPRLLAELEDKHGVHLLVLTIIHGVRHGDLAGLHEPINALRRVVHKQNLGEKDPALDLFALLLHKWVSSPGGINELRSRKSFRQLEETLPKLNSAGIPVPVVLWSKIWEILTS